MGRLRCGLGALYWLPGKPSRARVGDCRRYTRVLPAANGDGPLHPLPARRLPPVRPGPGPARTGPPARAEQRVHRRPSRTRGPLLPARAGAARGRQRDRARLAVRSGDGAGMGALRWLALLPGLLLTGAAMAADVNLAKPGGGSPSAWQGRLLGEVAAEGEVERVLLLRAVTSAPAELDLANVRRMLIENAAAPLQPPDAPEAPWRVRDGTWHALLLMRD